ncbi:HesA/MoeB/ThiF family protein [uncultured Methanospirillum sp.]|uniref:HesA/MoeB/ThiF family protein n=1 Tax=uncultured Methanospirillum sp. TaxID=262503 RepID=UPI0029C90D64|nr:HesA/MoeB/ThiF family protein [uncultured Methanospirillum sp.]
MTLTSYDQKRYNRQILIRGFGEAGQERLKNATVFVAGCGGLGCPVATYLAVAGIGHLVIVDMDVVDASNLNRQILHWDENVDQYKVKSASAKLAAINPSIKVTGLQEKIDEANYLDLTKGSDIIIDAMDNYPTRYLLNKAAIYHNIPFIHASVWGLEGRLTTIIPGKTPCLECLVPEAPPKEVFPVLGATPGVMGTLQVTEAIKAITGVGKLALNRMVIYDGEYLEFHELPLSRNPVCPACSHLK